MLTGTLFSDSAGTLLFRYVSQRDGYSGDTFAGAYRSHPVGGFGFDRNAARLDTRRSSDRLAHGGNERTEFGLFGDENGIDILDPDTFLVQYSDGLFEQICAHGVAPLGFGVREVCTDVAGTRSAEQRVDDSMHERVGVRVARQTPVERYRHTAENERSTFGKPVAVESESYV